MIHKKQKENLLNDGKMFLKEITREQIIYARAKEYEEKGADVCIDFEQYMKDRKSDTVKYIEVDESENFLKYCCPYKVGDDVTFIQEEKCNGDCVKGLPCLTCGDAGSISCRYDFPVKSIKCVKVQDVDIEDWFKIENGIVPCETEIMRYIDSIFGQGTYESNKWMFLVEVE